MCTFWGGEMCISFVSFYSAQTYYFVLSEHHVLTNSSSFFSCHFISLSHLRHCLLFDVACSSTTANKISSFINHRKEIYVYVTFYMFTTLLLTSFGKPKIIIINKIRFIKRVYRYPYFIVSSS